MGFNTKADDNLLPEGGIYQWKRRGEAHLFNPTTVHLLQHATRSNDYNVYKNYAKVINEQTEKHFHHTWFA
jgi:glutamate synthase (NADPH/NADH) large chain